MAAAFAASAAVRPSLRGAVRHAVSARRSGITASRPRRRGTICAQRLDNGVHQDALQRFASELSAAHAHLANASELLRPARGAAERARAEGVDMGRLSTAYGHVLAREARTLGERLDAGVAATALADSASMAAPAAMHEFEFWLRSGGEDGGAEMSAMYGFVLGRALDAAALELDAVRVAAGLRDACTAGAAFPMDDATYDAEFGVLQAHADALTAVAWERVSDEFFSGLRGKEGVDDLEGDGFVLGVSGITKGSGERVGETAEVEVVLHGRFFDGRSFVVPTYSDGLHRPPDTVRVQLAEVPKALRSCVVGMRVGECRCVFLHTYAAVEIVELFGDREKFPPNVALVFDVYLQAVNRGE